MMLGSCMEGGRRDDREEEVINSLRYGVLWGEGIICKEEMKR